jgi:hypothetical protein
MRDAKATRDQERFQLFAQMPKIEFRHLHGMMQNE